MKILLGYILLGLSMVSCIKVQTDKEYPIVPYPASVEIRNGHFTFSEETRLLVKDHGQFADETAYLQQFIQGFLSRGLTQATREVRNILVIELCDEEMPRGGYRLDVTHDRILISSPHKDGIFYALQTLRQLLFSAQLSVQRGEHKRLRIPCGSIVDYPAFEWRGLMLDVSRHFFTIEYLKKQIDLLSYFKMNKFHLHLTDDQGWRIEIKKYPELTQQGAWRTFNGQDSTCIERARFDQDYALDPRFIINHFDDQPLYGGFYTQDEIRDLVRYAQSRHVEIIPEIDMPGHMAAAISIFPELSCSGEAGWGTTFSYPLCPCNEFTYTFLENVLDEIAALFPSRYIHIGVDEVEKDTWADSDACRKLMKEKGFDKVEQLQTLFVDRIQSFLSSRGKEIIAWDEILEGGINPDVNVMFWRDWLGGVPEKAVNNGNHVIFVPTSPLYFSQMDSALFPVYHIQKMFDAMPEEKQYLIRGAQACIWTELIPSENMASRHIYPRLLALSEATWTNKESLDWNSFKQRLTNQLVFLNAENVKHPSRSYKLIPTITVNEEGRYISLRLESEQTEPKIYYTTDGSIPTEHSQLFTDGIIVSDSASICAAIYDKGIIQLPLLRRSLDYHKAINKLVSYHSTWHNAYPANSEHTLTDGLRGGDGYNDGFWQGFTTNLDVTIDMQELTHINSFSAMFMQITGPGVYMPEYVEVSLSEDGTHFEKVLRINNDIPESEQSLVFRKFAGRIDKTARYIKVFAKCKEGQFIFTDELVIH